MDKFTITVEEFLAGIRAFKEISDTINDGWKICENKDEVHRTYMKKDSFIISEVNDLCKVEFIVFYNLSYGVPSFSFNIWRSSGVLLKLDEIRKTFSIKMSSDEFYSVITQQEHPLFGRPFFIMHPCYTGQLLNQLKDNSKNIIVSFLSLIQPLLKFSLRPEYGL